jgi:hypothetical protein
MAQSAVSIEVEADPTPLVLIIAATLRRAARTQKLAETMRSMHGSVALKSSVDPQACTVQFGDGRAKVVRGVTAGADVIIEADLNRMSDKDAPKPKVSGAARHPKLALAAGKILEPPIGTWQEEGAAFWAFAQTQRGCPKGLRVVCNDQRSEATFGTTPADYEIHGDAHALATLFSGGSIFGEDLLAGKLCAVGTLPQLAALTGCSLAMMMGAGATAIATDRR